MNTKVAYGIIGGIVLVIAGYFIASHLKSSPVSETASSPATSTSAVIGAPANLNALQQTLGTANTKTPPLSVTVAKVALFDSVNMTATTSYPLFSGLANVKYVSVIVVNSDGVGLAAGRDIPVVNGRWNYSAPTAFAPGKYSIQLIGGDRVTQTSLTVTQ